ncbi:MAG: aminoglycoside phosphotransferase family protein [Chloroflexota bacterium]
MDVSAFLVAKGLVKSTTEVSVSRLKGGYWNDVFRVRGDGFDWVAKVFRTGWSETLYPIMPDAEAKALEVLGGETAVSPTSIAYFPKTETARAVLIYEFWPGSPWERGVVRVADLLKRLHAIEVVPDLANCFRPMPTNPEGIMQQGDRLLDVIPDDVQGQRIRRLRPAIMDGGEGMRVKRPFVIHTDFGPANMIDGPKGLRIIDWQCPGLGDPVEDVWSFLSPALNILFQHASLTPEEKECFLQAYGGDGIRERLAYLTRYFSYRMMAYCALRVANTADEAIGAVYQQALEAEWAEVFSRVPSR